MKIKIFTGSTPEEIETKFDQWLNVLAGMRGSNHFNIQSCKTQLVVNQTETSTPSFYLLVHYPQVV